MASNNISPELFSMNKLLEQYFAQPLLYQPVTGIANGNGDFLDGLQHGLNLKRAVLNNGIQRDINKDIIAERNKIRGVENPYSVQNNTSQVLAQNGYSSYLDAPQKNVYNIGSNGGFNTEYNTQVQQPQANTFQNMLNIGLTSVGDNDNLVNQYGQNNPFGLSANDEGQRIAEQGNISPEQLNRRQVWSTYPTGQQQVQSNPLEIGRYLSDEYRTDNYVNSLQQNYGLNPLIGKLYSMAFMDPIRQEARRARLEENFKIYNDPNATDEMKSRALAGMSYDLQNPDLVYDINQKREKDALARRRVELEERQLMAQQGYMLNPDYDENVSDSIGNSIVSTALNNYKEGEQWMSPDGTGDSRTQCSNWVSDVLKKSGVKGLSHPNGDELMKQAGSAYRTGLSGIQPGDVLNFKDHVGFYIGNGQYMARNSSGGVHRGSMEEAVKYFGQPLGYISMSQYTGNRRGLKYISNPNYVSPRERFEQLRENNAWERVFKVNLLAQQRELAEQRISARNGSGITGSILDKKGNIVMPYEIDRDVENAFVSMGKDLLKQEENGAENINPNLQIALGIVGTLKPVYKKLIEDGLTDSLAKSAIKSYLNKKHEKLDKLTKEKLNISHINNMVDNLSIEDKENSGEQTGNKTEQRPMSDKEKASVNTFNGYKERYKKKIRQDFVKKWAKEHADEGYTVEYEDGSLILENRRMTTDKLNDVVERVGKWADEEADEVSDYDVDEYIQGLDNSEMRMLQEQLERDAYNGNKEKEDVDNLYNELDKNSRDKKKNRKLRRF